MVQNMAIFRDTNAQIYVPTSIVHRIKPSLPMIEQSRWLTIQTMNLKNQVTKRMDAGSGIRCQGTVLAITRLVVMNNSKEQTHIKLSINP